MKSCLLKVGLWEFRRASPARLSGGQKQRLAVADALAGNPECIVLDEPTAMLDPVSRKEVIRVIRELNQREKITIVLITHHTDEVVDADKIFLMKGGHIIGAGTPDEIFADEELLKEAKMDLPQMTQLGMRLKKRGIEIHTPVLDEETMTREILRLYGEKKCEGQRSAGR